MTENFTNVNNQVKDTIINCVKAFRKEKKKHSNGLLALLWYYDDNDEIICQIEEMNRPIYEPLEEYFERKRKEQEEKDKKDFTKRLKNNLNTMQMNNKNNMNSKILIEEKKKMVEEKIKKTLAEKRRIANVMSGLDYSYNDLILQSSTKIKRTNSMNDFQLKIKNNIQTGKSNSNLLLAMKNANQRYMQKGINQENSKKQFSILEYNAQNKKLRRNNSQLNTIRSYGIMSLDQRNQLIANGKDYKYNQKMAISKILIQKEGKYIRNTNRPLKYYLAKNIMIDRNMGLPYNLEEEENRELKAITGYNKEYKKNIKYYFKCYSNEVRQTMLKSKFIRMMRDKGIDSDRMDYDEINTLMRRLFKGNLNELTFNQFINLLVQVSFLIYSKRRPTLTIGETYGFLLKRFSLNSNNNSKKLELLKRKYEKVIDYLLELKAEKEPFNLSEGFKFVKKTKVKYNSRLAPHFLEILGEGKFICYQILEDIIFNIFNSSIIEPYVEIKIEETVEIEPEKLHNWTPDLTMAYIDLDREYRYHGIFAADALEDGLRKILKNKMKINIENFANEKNIVKQPSKLKMSWARKDINKKMEQYKQKKMEEKEKKMKKRIDLFKLSKEEKEKMKINFEDIKKRRIQKEEERKNKLISEQERRKEKEEKKIKNWMDFHKNQKRKLKTQFKEIISKRKEFVKIEEERKENEIKIKKAVQEKSLANKDRNYHIFEKNFYNRMKEIIAKKEIKDIIDNYNNHLKLIYDIYSKISCTKISFFTKEVIKIEEFKQFLINFTVLGVIISPEQMIWIFNNISKVQQNERNNMMYFDFDDFKLSLCYLTIFCQLGNKEKRILPKDMDKINPENIEYFFTKILGLKIPFNKIEIEKFINERRSLTTKNLIFIQNKLKKENSLKINNELNEKKNDISNIQNENIKNQNKMNENQNKVKKKRKSIVNQKKEKNNEEMNEGEEDKNIQKKNSLEINNSNKNDDNKDNNVNQIDNINEKITENDEENEKFEEEVEEEGEEEEEKE